MKYKTKVVMTGCVGMAVSVLLLICSLWEQQPLTELSRPGKGADSVTEHLQVQIGEDKTPIDVTVAAVPYDRKEEQTRIREASKNLETIFLGQNTSLDHVTMDLHMPTQIGDSEVTVQWYLDSWKYLEPDGTLKNEGLEEPVWIQVQALLSFGEENLTWNRTIQICPPEAPDTAMMIRMLQYQLQECQAGYEETVQLPAEVSEQAVTWYPQRDTRWLWTTLLTGAALCGLWTGKKREDEQRLQKYERKMQLAYPDIVNRLSLYMGAGISIRHAWERIIRGYEKQRQMTGNSEDAYEQMKLALRQMQNGVAETVAYEQFGMDCRLSSYLKLGTLLSQNLRLGTGNLAEMLKAEAKDAFEDRKALARKIGEECESRLLLPMLLMLLSILIMIMYPAVSSFAG
ncbi:MAG: type II secretion system F family protein [Clostridiaceae bacterium]|nr:type II secretion system F family protein [Clostridiaceae bacterium]